MKSLPRSALPWLSSAAIVALIVGFLAVQNARHGWPFSLHHGLAEETHAAHTASAKAKGDATRRASVDLARGEYDRLGIRLEPARLEPIGAAARYTAVVSTDESRVAHVHTRISGWIEKLYLNTTGEAVRAGQPVAEVFSQELLASQNEFLAASRQNRALSGSSVYEAARSRLAVLGMSAAEIDALERAGTPRRTLSIVAPRSGIVLRRGVTVGTAVDPSTELVTIADLSRVWVLVEVPEVDSAALSVGSEAALGFPALGALPLMAKVEFVYPTLSEQTRTVRVRFALDNHGGKLRPGLFGTASFNATGRTALTVPRDAVIDTGDSQHVFVRTSDETLEPRTVRLGLRLPDRVEIVSGISQGDEVVASGVFLIDSESRLRASGGGHAGHGSRREPDSSEPAGHSGHNP